MTVILKVFSADVRLGPLVPVPTSAVSAVIQTLTANLPG